MNSGTPHEPAEREGAEEMKGTERTEGAEELTCKEAVELATEYLEGALPPAGRARFESHLAGCPGCRIYLDQLRKTIRLLGSLREEGAGMAPQTVEALRGVFRDWKGRQ